ncbi:MAG: hypothetical protein ACI9UU_003560, partial [Candidatus Azotimanducaceae bacterium]
RSFLNVQFGFLWRKHKLQLKHLAICQVQNLLSGQAPAKNCPEWRYFDPGSASGR